MLHIDKVFFMFSIFWLLQSEKLKEKVKKILFWRFEESVKGDNFEHNPQSPDKKKVSNFLLLSNGQCHLIS